jgi:hypothetical protein
MPPESGASSTYSLLLRTLVVISLLVLALLLFVLVVLVTISRFLLGGCLVAFLSFVVLFLGFARFLSLVTLRLLAFLRIVTSTLSIILGRMLFIGLRRMRVVRMLAVR